MRSRTKTKLLVLFAAVLVTATTVLAGGAAARSDVASAKVKITF